MAYLWANGESGRDFIRRVATEVSSLEPPAAKWTIAGACARFLPLVEVIGSSQTRHAANCVGDLLWSDQGEYADVLSEVTRCPELGEDDSSKQEYYAGYTMSVLLLGLAASRDCSRDASEKVVYAGFELTGELVALAGEATSAEEEDAALRRLEDPFWNRCLSAASAGDSSDVDALKRVVHEAGYRALIDRAIQRKGWLRQPYR